MMACTTRPTHVNSQPDTASPRQGVLLTIVDSPRRRAARVIVTADEPVVIHALRRDIRDAEHELEPVRQRRADRRTL